MSVQKRVQCLLSAQCNFCRSSVMYIGPNLTYFQNNLFKAHFNELLKRDKVCYHLLIIKAKIIYDIIEAIPLYVTAIFGTR